MKLASVFLLLVLTVLSSCSSTPGTNTTNNNYYTNTIIVTNIPSTPGVGSEWTCARTSASFGLRSGHTSVVFNSNIWVISGWAPIIDAWFSPDGILWKFANLAPSRAGQAGVVYKNHIWLIGGQSLTPWQLTNGVMYSSDGTNWLSATANPAFGARQYFTAVVFNNNLWLIGGDTGVSQTNDVWCSTNGTNWMLITNSAPFLNRQGHTCVVFNNSIWVVGGLTYNGVFWISLNDVWYSPNGTNWYCANNSAAFPIRSAHTSIVYDNKLWVISGTTSGSGLLDDAWYTTDGTNWVCAKLSGAFPPRTAHSSVVFDNKIWVIGGGGAGTNQYSDVWYSQ